MIFDKQFRKLRQKQGSQGSQRIKTKKIRNLIVYSFIYFFYFLLLFFFDRKNIIINIQNMHSSLKHFKADALTSTFSWDKNV